MRVSNDDSQCRTNIVDAHTRPKCQGSEAESTTVFRMTTSLLTFDLVQDSRE
jgi:hypothetical protein